MPLSVALETRALKEKERIEEDPALSTRPIPSPLPKPSLSTSSPSHPISSATIPSTTITAAAAGESPGLVLSSSPSRVKSRPSAFNGRTGGARSKDKNKELLNGDGQPLPQPPSESEQKPHSRRGSRRSEQQGWAEPVSTEQHLALAHLHPGGPQQLQWQDHPPPPPLNAHTNPQPWLAGPASGFLDERVHVPEGPFGSTGRTIYSQR